MLVKGSKLQISQAEIKQFQAVVWDYFRRAGRRDLPWRKTGNPYRIFISEIMLQQTQVSRVIPKYREFVSAFPSFRVLARAKIAQVLRVWQGLGYNRRALYAHRAAAVLVREYGGRLPESEEALRSLPGIGPGTVGSLRAFVFNLPAVFLETNIRRAIIHHFFPRRRSVPEAEVRAVASCVLDARRPRLWYSALMDYGAMLGAALPGSANANRRSAIYAKQSRFTGSDRELRGRILRRVLRAPVSSEHLAEEFDGDVDRMSRLTRMLIKEGFIKRSRGVLRPAE